MMICYTCETYPSGRIVNTCMDGANRAFQVSISQCGDASFAYASNVKYAVHGAPTQIVMGNNLWHNPVYNSRLQMSSFQDLLNNNANVTLWSGNLNWGSSNNNGNLAGVTYYAGGPGYPQLLTFNQAFTYDGLNRLVSASETGGWSRTFAYDAYGNMTPSGTPAPPTVSFNSNNQIVGQQYDQAGNLLSANGNTLGYDFEGRIISEKDGQTQAVETYVFDADGRRVEKYGPSGTARIVYAYDALGRMAAENSTVAEAPSCVTCYLSADHLGTTRLITDQNGLVVARHDFMPFGEEIQGSTYGRDSHWGLGNDSITQKFTGKERDSESGLDYFGARYYGSALGRFTSPDPLLSSGTIYNPQTWNRYSYGLNNPLKYLDPTGLYVCNGDKSQCKDFANALKDAAKARDSFKKGSSQYNLLNSAINSYGKAGVDNGVSVRFGATRSGGGAGDTNVGVSVDSSGSKITTADNPTGQNTIVTIDPSKNTSTDLMAVTAAHEGVHVSDGSALVGGLPMNLAGSDAAAILSGPLNLTQYSTEFHAYQASSYTAQGLGFGSLSVGHGFEIWNSGWGAADAETMRSKGINGILADPTGLYKVTPDAPGKKLIQ